MDNRNRIEEISRCCLRIISQCEGQEKLKDVLSADLTLQESILFNLIQIGEQVNRLSDDLKERNNNIPWRQVVGMRNIIAHAYGSVDIENIAETVKYDIPELYNAMRNIQY